MGRVPRTDEQKQTLREHKRRETAAATTIAEVDVEVTELLERAKSGTITLAEVDKMRARKDLEYDIEIEHNLNLTADSKARPDGSRVTWSAPELEQVQASLSQIPEEHLQGKKAFDRIERTQSKNGETKQGEFFGDHIKIYDTAMTPVPGYTENEPRTNVSYELRREHGGMVGSLEYALTHEIGHGVEATNPDVFKKFKESARWAADGKGGSPSIPTKDETGSRRWDYAKGNAQEHFAEVYAKAVHMPQMVHADLVENPTRIATTARAEVNQRRAAIAKLEADPASDPATLQAMSAELATEEEEAIEAENTATQRAGQFNTMRNGVFGTDKAVASAVSRLRVRNVGDGAIADFEKDAAKVSTLDQVSALEQKVKR